MSDVMDLADAMGRMFQTRKSDVNRHFIDQVEESFIAWIKDLRKMHGKDLTDELRDAAKVMCENVDIYISCKEFFLDEKPMPKKRPKKLMLRCFPCGAKEMHIRSGKRCYECSRCGTIQSVEDIDVK